MTEMVFRIFVSLADIRMAGAVGADRSREKGIVVLNQKSGDFGSYTLPRLSVEGYEREVEPQASAQTSWQPGDERRESQVVMVSEIVGKVRKEQQEEWKILVRKNVEKVNHLIKKHRSDRDINVSKVNTLSLIHI